MPKFIAVTNDSDVYCFSKEEKLFEFLNEEGEYAPPDGDGKREWVILKEFPTPSDKNFNGSYCPFTAWDSDTQKSVWPVDGVFILKDGQTYVPEKRTITKTVSSFEYGPPVVLKGWAKRRANEAAKLALAEAKKPARKAAKKRRGRPRRAASNE